jgi:hypothetical protein
LIFHSCSRAARNLGGGRVVDTNLLYEERSCSPYRNKLKENRCNGQSYFQNVEVLEELCHKGFCLYQSCSSWSKKMEFVCSVSYKKAGT